VKKTYASLLVLVFALWGLAEPQGVVGQVAGTWQITEARTYEGGSYTGSVAFTAKGSVLDVDWKTSAGSYSGVAITEGNNIYVGWGMNVAHGVSVYDVTPTQLKGIWTTRGQSQTGTENVVLQFGKVIGTHSLTGTQAGGKGTYEGKLTIKASGSLYEFRWNVGTQSYQGIGLQVGTKLVVGWGMGSNYGVVHYAVNGSTAKGQWAIPGATAPAIENLRR
jgi:hypothetical protein